MVHARLTVTFGKSPTSISRLEFLLILLLQFRLGSGADAPLPLVNAQYANPDRLVAVGLEVNPSKPAIGRDRQVAADCNLGNATKDFMGRLVSTFAVLRKFVYRYSPTTDIAVSANLSCFFMLSAAQRSHSC